MHQPRSRLPAGTTHLAVRGELVQPAAERGGGHEAGALEAVVGERGSGALAAGARQQAGPATGGPTIGAGTRPPPAGRRPGAPAPARTPPASPWRPRPPAAPLG